MDNVAMKLNTNPDAFVKWLEKRLNNSFAIPGQYWIDKARQAYRTNGDLMWEVAARHVGYNPDKDTSTLYPDVVAMQFEVADLGNEWIELTGRCLLDDGKVQRKFRELLAEIRNTWPEQRTTLAETRARKETTPIQMSAGDKRREKDKRERHANKGTVPGIRKAIEYYMKSDHSITLLEASKKASGPARDVTIWRWLPDVLADKPKPEVDRIIEKLRRTENEQRVSKLKQHLNHV
jgi:hypothetical protein